MELILLNQVALALFCALLVVAAIQDVSEYRIPNAIIVMIAVLYPIYFFSAPHAVSWGWSLLIALVFFMIGLGLFSANIMGGGDVKLISVAGLWVGLEGLTPFLLGMAVVGGVMSLFMMISPIRQTAAYLCVQMGFARLQEKILTDQIPYGVAICAGGLFAVYQMYMA